MILKAYQAQAKIAGMPIQPFGEPNAWLNYSNFHDFYAEVVEIAKQSGITFLPNAPQAMADDEVPMLMHE